MSIKFWEVKTVALPSRLYAGREFGCDPLVGRALRNIAAARSIVGTEYGASLTTDDLMVLCALQLADRVEVQEALYAAARRHPLRWALRQVWAMWRARG